MALGGGPGVQGHHRHQRRPSSSLQKLFRPRSTNLFEANSDQIFHHFQVWRLLTATFLHADVWHIVMNMLFLWMVGREMESFYGTRDFAAMYLSAAVFSTLCWAVADTFSPHAGLSPLVGASGAVMAVVVLYTLYYPRREVMLMFIIPVEMWLLLVIFLVFDLLGFLSPTCRGEQSPTPPTSAGRRSVISTRSATSGSPATRRCSDGLLGSGSSPPNLERRPRPPSAPRSGPPGRPARPRPLAPRRRP